MLNTKNLNDIRFEDRLGEAITQIPLYSQEWTNFNPSDPGITILENLTAFESLQLQGINQITVPIRQKLLQLVGFEAKKGKCARVLLCAEGVTHPISFPANQRFHLGTMAFETNKPVELTGDSLTGIYGKRDDVFYDYTEKLEREIPIPCMIFGENPKSGDAVYFAANHLPDPDEEIIFYVRAFNRHNRNPFSDKWRNTFAALKWECYTQDGFVEVNVADRTGCFLIDGEIRIRMPGQPAAGCNELDGSPFVIRATLTDAHYDVIPKVMSIDSFLFEVWQKETKCTCFTFNKVGSASLFADLLEEGYVKVFCKEERGSAYREYKLSMGEAAEGRFYEEERTEYGKRTFRFDKRRYKYAPAKLKNAIKIVCYNEEMMRRYSLGMVYGYDNQVIDLPITNIVADSFCIIAAMPGEDGEPLYYFVRPDKTGDQDMIYHLLENDGKIVIEDAGMFIGAKLYMCECSVTSGEEGNIREGNVFEAAGLHDNNVTFFNPGPGQGGAFREKLKEVKKRFIKDIQKPYAAVTANDYEQIVKETPELCIDRVKAVLDESRNLVRVAVKPGTDEELPELSAIYKEAIERRLEDRRLLTTRIEVSGVLYVPLQVQGTIYIKRQYENCRERIEETIRNMIDFAHDPDRAIGEPLRFDELFYAIDNLDCVEYVYELSVRPQSSAHAHLKDADVIPDPNCLFCKGSLSLEIGTYGQE
ncbi:MAG: baseplate J/gp47 family protein [Lachnospiraceae bacterium]|nr:baseplate J/gp47 family protein [Lachnospiraceae bacterium]